MHLSHLPHFIFFQGDVEYYGSFDTYVFFHSGRNLCCSLEKNSLGGITPIPLTPFFFWTKNDETGRGMDICYLLADILGFTALSRDFLVLSDAFMIMTDEGWRGLWRVGMTGIFLMK